MYQKSRIRCRRIRPFHDLGLMNQRFQLGNRQLALRFSRFLRQAFLGISRLFLFFFVWNLSIIVIEDLAFSIYDVGILLR